MSSSRRVKKRNTVLYPPKVGPQRVEERISLENARKMYLPEGVSIEDIDISVFDFIENTFKLVANSGGNTIPLLSLHQERFMAADAEFNINDNKNNIPVMPYMTIIRKEAAEIMKTPVTRYFFPKNFLFNYTKIPYWDGDKKYYELYKIPIPISIDLKYEVKIFSKYMEDINNMDTKVLETFRTIQCGVPCKGYIHLMRHKGTSTAHELGVEAERYYCNVYDFVVTGQLRDENEYVNVTSLRSSNVAYLPPSLMERFMQENNLDPEE